jgi:hypothetical protein
MSSDSGSLAFNAWITLEGKVDIKTSIFADDEIAEFAFSGGRFGITATEDAIEQCIFEFSEALRKMKIEHDREECETLSE